MPIATKVIRRAAPAEEPKKLSLRERREAQLAARKAAKSAPEPEVEAKEEEEMVVVDLPKKVFRAHAEPESAWPGPIAERILTALDRIAGAVEKIASHLSTEAAPERLASTTAALTKTVGKPKEKPAPAVLDPRCPSCSEVLTPENSSKNLATGKHTHINCPRDEPAKEEVIDVVAQREKRLAAEAKPAPAVQPAFEDLRAKAVAWVQARNGEGKDGKALLVEVMKRFHPDGRLNAIPDDKRAAFLEALNG